MTQKPPLPGVCRLVDRRKEASFFRVSWKSQVGIGFPRVATVDIEHAYSFVRSNAHAIRSVPYYWSIFLVEIVEVSRIVLFPGMKCMVESSDASNEWSGIRAQRMKE